MYNIIVMLLSKYRYVLLVLSILLIILACSKTDKKTTKVITDDSIPPSTLCDKQAAVGVDVKTPSSEVSDWGTPVKMGEGINTFCPEDAIEISSDGSTLYYMFLEDIADNLTYDEMTNLPNGTYKATKTSADGPGDFHSPVFFDLGLDVAQSLDGELSFYGSTFYFHSNRPTNTGLDPVQLCVLGTGSSTTLYDLLDIYTGNLDESGLPVNITNSGLPNSICWDGEHTIYPNGQMLFFASNRKRSDGDTRTDKDIWMSAKSNGTWGLPRIIGLENINSSANEIQPTFTSDGQTMYFTSDRSGEVRIYRSVYNSNTNVWQTPEVVISGVVGEAALTADGEYLYFVHVLTDASGAVFDADIWYSQKQ